jgi:transcriptional regulator with XRE-family HTH domain
MSLRFAQWRAGRQPAGVYLGCIRLNGVHGEPRSSAPYRAARAVGTSRDGTGTSRTGPWRSHRDFRRRTGASQTDIGMLVGIPQPHISGIENGKRLVTSLDLFERFADGLGIPKHLLGLADDTDKHSSADSGSTGLNYRSREADQKVHESHQQWLEARRKLGLNRAQLTQAVSGLYPPSVRVGSTGLLMPDSWKLREPVDLATVKLVWQEDAPSPMVNGGEAETVAVRPLGKPDRRYSRYHRAMHDLDRPRLFENRLCYRLLNVVDPGDATPGQVTIDLALSGMCYFDMIDVGEALAHEAALAAIDQQDRVRPDQVSWQRLPFRRLVRDPFALSQYPLMISVSTLTVRKSAAGATFYLLRRNPKKVAIAGGMLSVFPTGVFQPASVIPAPESPDFDLWRNVMREYSEEYLGNPEHDGDGPTIDYENTEPFRSLDAARRARKIRISCLGIGIDALNYVGDILTVAVFEADVFDAIFDGMVTENDEGDLASDQATREFEFSEETIETLLATEPFAPSGAACLYLALKHSASLV